MLIDETTEITRNAERYAARRYSAHAAKQRRYLESAYNATAESRKAYHPAYRYVCSNTIQWDHPTSRVTAQTSIPALDHAKRAARLYVAPMSAESAQIVIFGVKSIVCLGLFLVFLAMIGV